MRLFLILTLVALCACGAPQTTATDQFNGTWTTPTGGEILIDMDGERVTLIGQAIPMRLVRTDGDTAYLEGIDEGYDLRLRLIGENTAEWILNDGAPLILRR